MRKNRDTNNTLRPSVTMLHNTPIFVGEVAARTCYDSFSSSPEESIREFIGEVNEDLLNIDRSPLLEKLTHVYHHGSVVEHISINFLVGNISRGVLMELSRHRIASYSVRSTRYTMGDLLMAYLASKYLNSYNVFVKWVKENEVFIVTGNILNLEIRHCYDKITLIVEGLFYDSINNHSYFEIPKAMSTLLTKEPHEELLKFTTIEEFLEVKKYKKNIGDDFKLIVTDNWGVDLVMTFNLRSLKNFLKLRDSGAAYYQIRHLSEEIKKVIPLNLLNLMVKPKHNKEG